MLSIRAKAAEWDDTFQLMSWWKSDKVKQAKVMVIGAGALGNEVIKNLALMNVGHILIVDYDTIEYANLCRSVLFREEDVTQKRYKADMAAQRIKEINPNVKTKVLKEDVLTGVGLGIFRRMDVTIGCVDGRLARLWINRYSQRVGKTWVDGAIQELIGQVDVYTPEISCYASQLTKTAWANLDFRLTCPDVARRNVSIGRIPTTPVVSSIVGAMQVQEALKVIHQYTEQSWAGQTYSYNGMSNVSTFYKSLPVKPGYSESLYTPIHECADLSADNTLQDIFDKISEFTNYSDPIIELDFELVTQVTAMRSGKNYPILVSKLNISESTLASARAENPGEELIITKKEKFLDKNSPYKDKTLLELGFPYLDILSIRCGNEYLFVELTKDENYMNFE